MTFGFGGSPWITMSFSNTQTTLRSRPLPTYFGLHAGFASSVFATGCGLGSAAAAVANPIATMLARRRMARVCATPSQTQRDITLREHADIFHHGDVVGVVGPAEVAGLDPEAQRAS